MLVAGVWYTSFPHVGYPTATARIDSSLKRVLDHWWIHDALHASFHDRLSQLLLIEYGFHVTMMVAAAYLVFLASKIFRRESI